MSAPPFAKVLVANRGEIAVRVIQACRELGIAVVAVYSEADAEALHVRLADEAYAIGPASATASYLNIEKLIEVARESGAQAVHPGYGFLAENSRFAQACLDAGLVFVGPSPQAMEAMGGKIPARRLAESIGVPVVPGESAAIESVKQARVIAARIGYPIAFKASAGGGGRGLKVARSEEELPAALESAQREGTAYFKDPTVFIERYVAEPRHVETQILADTHGNAVSLGQRDCSVQRHHQKLIEEAPALIPEAMRAAMDAACLDLVRRIGYVGAGTLEFLVDGDAFYFLEMNTRIQVEHTVTEMVTGIDLVQAQLRVAAGEPLWFTQDEVVTRGHAIQCRINAEDPAHNFRPAPSQVRAYRAPTGAGIRVDSAVYAGYTIPSHYDSMIAKLIAHAEDREAARRRMLRALDEFILEGPPTTIPFHLLALAHDEFALARATTGFVARLDLASLPSPPNPLSHGERGSKPSIAVGGRESQLSFSPLPEGEGSGVRGPARRFAVRVEGTAYTVEVAELAAAPSRQRRERTRGGAGTSADGAVVSPMHGVVIRVPVTEGASVVRGAVVCVIEAMKMENEILAPHDGTVAAIAVAAGETVESGARLLTVMRDGAEG